MRRRSAVRDTLEYWMALAVVESLASTPLPVANWLARRYAGLLNLALPRLRRVALSNLAMALPELDRRAHRRIVDGVFRSIARLLVTFARFPRIHRGNIGDWIRYQGFEHFEAGPQTRPRRAVCDGAPGQLGAERIRACPGWPRPCT